MPNTAESSPDTAKKVSMDSRKWIWKETAEVIAVLGVIASLCFVAFEIRQNTNATLSTALQAVTEQSVAVNLVLAQDAEIVAIYRESLSDGWADRLTEVQQMQLAAFYTALMRGHQNRFQLSKLGIIDKEDVYSTGGYGRAYRSPFFLEYWRAARNNRSPEFTHWFENEIGLADEFTAR